MVDSQNPQYPGGASAQPQQPAQPAAPQQPVVPQQPAPQYAPPQGGPQQPAQPVAPQQAPSGPKPQVPGKGAATASMVLGIIGVVCWFFGYSSIISVICGIIGLILSISSKKAGFEGGVRTAGLVLSIISLVGGALVFIACVACTGLLVGVGSSM